MNTENRRLRVERARRYLRLELDAFVRAPAGEPCRAEWVCIGTEWISRQPAGTRCVARARVYARLLPRRRETQTASCLPAVRLSAPAGPAACNAQKQKWRSLHARYGSEDQQAYAFGASCTRDELWAARRPRRRRPL
eukprot:6213513-Pleurochrysis_carterae.AAC.2